MVEAFPRRFPHLFLGVLEGENEWEINKKIENKPKSGGQGGVFYSTYRRVQTDSFQRNRIQTDRFQIDKVQTDSGQTNRVQVAFNRTGSYGCVLVWCTVAPRFKNMVPPKGSPLKGPYIALYRLLESPMFLTLWSCGHV